MIYPGKSGVARPRQRAAAREPGRPPAGRRARAVALTLLALSAIFLLLWIFNLGCTLWVEFPAGGAWWPKSVSVRRVLGPEGRIKGDVGAMAQLGPTKPGLPVGSGGGPGFIWRATPPHSPFPGYYGAVVSEAELAGALFVPAAFLLAWGPWRHPGRRAQSAAAALFGASALFLLLWIFGLGCTLWVEFPAGGGWRPRQATFYRRLGPEGGIKGYVGAMVQLGPTEPDSLVGWGEGPGFSWRAKPARGRFPGYYGAIVSEAALAGALFAAAALLLARARLRRREADAGLPCGHCGYDLRAHRPGDKCPECGTIVPDNPAAGGG